MGILLTTLLVAGSSLLTGSPNRVCYKKIGCFSNDKPWASLTRPVPLPQHPSRVSTTIVFFSRAIFNETIGVYPEISPRLTDVFNPTHKIYVLCHGWANSGYYFWEMAQAILNNRKDANIVSVNWGKSAELMDYPQAVADTRVVAAVVLRVVERLLTLGALPADIHFIGHSLGAHILAYVAKGMSVKVGRLTGLDIAGPGFEGQARMVRFSASDATYTEALHTNAGISGYVRPIAHVDYYFNGVLAQPGCFTNPIRQIFNLTVPKSPLTIITPLSPLICSHGSAYVFYKEAIQNQGSFIGRRIKAANVLTGVLRTLGASTRSLTRGCKGADCVRLSFDEPQTEYRGSVLVVTNGKAPFCIK